MSLYFDKGSHHIQIVVRASTRSTRRNYNKKSFRQKYELDYRLLPDPIDYYSKELERFKPRDGWSTALCPFHDDRNPSLSVHTQKGCWVCFSCGARGQSIVGFHAKKYGLSLDAAQKALEG